MKTLLLFGLKWINPGAGILLTVWQWMWWAISSFFRGFLSFLQNPLEVFSVIVLMTAALGFGAVAGIKWDAHRVRQAQTELATVYDGMAKKDRIDAQKAAEAVMARKAAEEEMRARLARTAELPKLDSVVAPAAPAAAVVRNKPATVRRRVEQPSVFDGLQGALQSALGGSK